MDASCFDALSRSFGLGASRRRILRFGSGGILATLVGRDPLPDAAAKKKKKKRCPPCKRRKNGKCRGALPDGSPCPDGACRGGNCRAGCLPADECCAPGECPLGTLCCDGVCTDELRAPGAACDADRFCCSNYCHFVRTGVSACAPTCRGNHCLLDRDCCRGFPCREVVATGERWCGGCTDHSGVPCEADTDCCFSDCVAAQGDAVKHCVSLPGGPCARSANCRSCTSGGACTMTVAGVPREICLDGVCGCPDDFECCSNADCPQEGTFCVFAIEGGDLVGECRSVEPGP